MGYRDLGEMVLDMCDALEPPERLTVSQSAEKYRKLNNPGSYVGPWKNDTTPYLVEPMDCSVSPHYSAVIFVGPAQSGKTDYLLNFINHTVICDPMDMLLFQTTQSAARDFSKRRIDRLLRHTPECGRRLMDTGSSDNVFDKIFKSGMIFTLSWPSISELSGRPVGRVMFTDYDRMPQDIDGEGSPFDLGRKRTTTFRSSATTIAESSPGFVVTDTKWQRSTPHESPPCDGILKLYNRGDRRRWHWPCPHCKQYFEPEFSLLQWPEGLSPVEAGEQAQMMCPHCASLISPALKYEMNKKGRWITEGQKITPEGAIVGPMHRSNIASFWLKGVAAAFAPWRDLVTNWINAEHEFARTGSQDALKATVNTDQGEPYFMRGTEVDRDPDALRDSNSVDVGEKVVPEGTRFLLASADVQKNRFVCQVFAVTPSVAGFSLTVIDRIDIVKSHRVDEDGEHLWVKPATFIEDWWLLKEQVLDTMYPLEDGSGYMGIKLMCCDSGGKEGVTSNAYAFWRKLRDEGDGAHKRFLLAKGDGNLNSPRVRVTYPDSSRKDRKAGARGEIPLLMFNVNSLKDRLNGMLDADMDSGSVSFADWLPDSVFAEMTAEYRDVKGWVKLKKVPNEAWDLAAYAIGLCVHLKVEHINWDDPPAWALPVGAGNSMVVAPPEEEGEVPVATEKTTGYTMAKLGELLG